MLKNIRLDSYEKVRHVHRFHLFSSHDSSHVMMVVFQEMVCHGRGKEGGYWDFSRSERSGRNKSCLGKGVQVVPHYSFIILHLSECLCSLLNGQEKLTRLQESHCRIF